MDKRIFTVSEINSRVKMLFDSEYAFKNISITGEISGLNKYNSGHWYFSLKDDKCELSCVMFANFSGMVKDEVKTGDKVVVSGHISAYPEKGKYQLYVRSLEHAGMGLEYIKLEKLKQKLSEEGLFEISSKKPMPRYPKKIGIVTSANGAAIKDILKVANDRNDSVELLLYDSLVQGKYAPESIIKGIEYFNKYNSVDLLIIGRGGGSFEDLMAFNDEGVARAIYSCDLPILSAVGHERDNSISDLVADARAATPSDAALIAIPDKDDILDGLLSYQSSLNRFLNNIINQNSLNLELLLKKIENFRPDVKLDINENKLIDRSINLDKAFELILMKRENYLDILNSKLEATQPISFAKRAYIQIYKHGKIIKSAKDVSVNDSIDFTFIDGEIKAKVTGVNIND